MPHRFDLSTRALEIVLSGILFLLGLVLVQQGETFSSAVFGFVRGMITEEAAGTICIAIGMFRLTAIFINGMWVRSPFLRGAGCCLGFSVWLTLSAGIYEATVMPGGTVGALPVLLAILPAFAVAELFSAARCGIDAVLYEEAHKRTGAYRRV